MRKLYMGIVAILCCFAMTITCLAEYDSSVVQQVQEALNAAGYDCGTPDGIAGSNTAAAISKYKEDHGLPVNGNIDDELLKCLGIEESQIATNSSSPYRNDISYEELMRNPYDHSSELYTFSGTVLQTFDSYKLRLALNGNSDEQVVCTYGWLQMPVDLLEGDTVTIYGTFEGKEKYANVFNVEVEFPQFLCYKMETPGGMAKPWTKSTIDIVKRAEEEALGGNNDSNENLDSSVFDKDIDSPEEMTRLIDSLQQDFNLVKDYPFFEDLHFSQERNGYSLYETRGAILGENGTFTITIKDETYVPVSYEFVFDTKSDQKCIDICNRIFDNSYIETGDRNGASAFYKWTAPENRVFELLCRYESKECDLRLLCTTPKN